MINLPKLGLLLLAALVPLSVACGGGGNGDDPEAVAVEQRIRTMIDAWNQQDAETFLSSWSPSAIEERFGATAQELRDSSESFLGEPTRTIREISDVSVRAGSGFASVEIEAGRAVYSDRYIVVQQGTDWVIDAADQVEPDLSGDTSMLEVEMAESTFTFDPSEAEDGDIAFQADNLGGQPHELTVWRVPPDFDVEANLEGAADETPVGVEVIGSTGPVIPQGTGWFALLEPLQPGRYVMVCLLPDSNDPEDTLHAAKGMIAEFEVSGAASAGP